MILYSLAVAWVLFIWFWDFPATGPLLSRVKSSFMSAVEYFGLGHSWNLLPDGENDRLSFLFIRSKLQNGLILDRYPTNASELRWLRTVRKDAKLLQSTLIHHLQRDPNARSVSFVERSQARPPEPIGIFKRSGLPTDDNWQEEVYGEVSR